MQQSIEDLNPNTACSTSCRLPDALVVQTHADLVRAVMSGTRGLAGLATGKGQRQRLVDSGSNFNSRQCKLQPCPWTQGPITKDLLRIALIG